MFKLLRRPIVLVSLFLLLFANVTSSQTGGAQTGIQTDADLKTGKEGVKPVGCATRTGFESFADILGAIGEIAPIDTPYDQAFQSNARAALDAREAVEGGATLYRGGILGETKGPEGQYWSLESPLNPNYAQRYGLPSSKPFDFIETGKLRPGARFITREAPGMACNPGGGIEAVVEPFGVELTGFISL